ncbi:MAG: glutaredoxin family protein [Rhodocyclaceae bacterium]|nr:glutaredoxin family protein [Rhodocyclaceae bacterium]
MSKPVFSLYGRKYCHLCEDMLAALETLRGEFSFEVTVVDVDTDPVLEERYDELVPVLTLGDAEICHYFLDVAKVREVLAGL